MKQRLTWLMLTLLLLLALAACGGGGGDDSGPGETGSQSEANAEATAVRATLPPTWTSVPSPTEPPRQATIDYNYQRATETTYIPPTYTPSPEPPTATPTEAPPTPTLGPTLPPVEEDLTLALPNALLNQAAQEAFDAGTAPFLVDAPRFNAQPPDTMIVLVNMQLELGNPDSAANIVIRVQVALDEEGKITLTKTGANLLGSADQLESEVIDMLLVALETRIDEALTELFAADVSGGVSYDIEAITVDETGLNVDITALQLPQPSSTPGPPTETAVPVG